MAVGSICVSPGILGTKVIVAPNSPIALAKESTIPAMMHGRISGSVTVTLNSGNSVAIGKGLRAGDTVVIDGQDKLQDGSRIDPRAPNGASVAQGSGSSDSGSAASSADASTASDSGEKPSKSQAARKDAER